MKTILLFQWFACTDSARKRELQECIEHNLELGFDEIIIFNDSVPPQYFNSSGRGNVKNIQKNSRITYRDYIRVVNDDGNYGSIVVLTNTDIKLDHKILSIDSVMQDNDFLCFSRYEAEGQLAKDPWCTQDAWAMISSPVHNSIIFQSEIPLGMPGCEIRFAEVMFGAGYSIYNPALDVRNLHFHSNPNVHSDKDRLYGAYVFTPPCRLTDVRHRNPACLGVPRYLTKYLTQTVNVEMPRARLPGLGTPKRNDPCPCGSGRRFKRCHGTYAT
jgi:hypothetical protein